MRVRYISLVIVLITLSSVLTASAGTTGNLNSPGSPPAPVEKTGQTTKYADGDDGEYRKGVAWPNPRFTDNDDGTVTDNLTGLIWLKNVNSNCFGQKKDWATALSDANNLEAGYCGLTDGSSPGDWRLPNVRELSSLTDFSQYNPALPGGHPFTGVQSDCYWSSTTVAGYTSYAWYVGMISGYVQQEDGDKTNRYYYVWPVRGYCVGYYVFLPVILKNNNP